MARKRMVLGALAFACFLTWAAMPVSAQTQLKMTAWPEMDDPNKGGSNDLAENRRASVGTWAHLKIEGAFACATAVDLLVQFENVDHPGDYGMSWVTEQQKTVTFTIAQGGHQEGYPDTRKAGPTMDVAWSEDAPVNHTHPYDITVAILGVSGNPPNDQDTCVPQLTSAQKVHQGDTKTQINFTRPYYAPPPAGDVDCTVEPDHEVCTKPENPDDGGGSPTLGAPALLAGMLGAALWARRRQDLRR